MVVSGGEKVHLMTTEADESFWSKLLAHIVEGGRRTPKFQVERAIGPILGFFLPKAISELLNSERHAHRKGQSNVVTLAAEFPLRKPGTGYQSTNIDWLMYDTSSNELLLVELKTEIASFQGDQLETYLELAATANPWKGMKEGFDNICKVTKSPKYRYAGKQLREVLDNCPDVENARVRVVYLAPKATAAAFDEAVKKFKPSKPTSALASDSAVCFFFEDLARFANGTAKDDLAPYRDKLFSALTALDRDLDESTEELTEASKKNYRGRLSLDEVLRNCKEDKSILVGFAGGSKALAQHNSTGQSRSALNAARQFADQLMAWYNHEHRHSEISYVTPDDRHQGRDIDILVNRRQVYEQARQNHPERWIKGTRNWSRKTPSTSTLYASKRWANQTNKSLIY